MHKIYMLYNHLYKFSNTFLQSEISSINIPLTESVATEDFEEEYKSLLSSWEPEFEPIKVKIMQNYEKPQAIPQFSINSDFKFLTQMQINLHKVTRMVSSRKNKDDKDELNKLFEEEVLMASSMSKSSKIYLINAAFCNFNEIRQDIEITDVETKGTTEIKEK